MNERKHFKNNNNRIPIDDKDKFSEPILIIYITMSSKKHLIDINGKYDRNYETSFPD